MPYYNLLVVSKQQILSDVAGNRAEALLKFGTVLGTTLTICDQGISATYLLDEWCEGPHWVKPTIPVFEQTTS